jgi:ABC-type dipeptide/oligopeptide/nickel transport system permease component
VLSIIGERLPYTLQLGGAALLLALTSGLVLGVAAAARPGSIVDRATSAFAAAAIEVVFGWPGMRQLFVDAALQRDYALLAGDLLVTSSAVIFGNLLADLAYAWADPRLRMQVRAA